MNRETSIQAYNSIVASGLLGQLQLEVLDIISKEGALTSGEISEYHTDSPRVSISPRLAELKKQGVVYESEKRPCTVTGRNCIAWDLTGNLPIILTKKDRILSDIVRLENKIAKLKIQLLNNL